MTSTDRMTETAPGGAGVSSRNIWMSDSLLCPEKRWTKTSSFAPNLGMYLCVFQESTLFCILQKSTAASRHFSSSGALMYSSSVKNHFTKHLSAIIFIARTTVLCCIFHPKFDSSSSVSCSIFRTQNFRVSLMFWMELWDLSIVCLTASTHP